MSSFKHESSPSIPKPVMLKDQLSFSQLGQKLNLASSDVSTSLTVFIVEMNRLIESLKHQSALSESHSETSWQKLSSNEKQFIIDVFCWSKDEFSVSKFYQLLPHILDSLENNPQAAVLFFNSYEFHLFLKSQFDFYDFDQEEQNYPEDDNFFITKDFSFVFHYQNGEKSSEYIEGILDLVLQVAGSENFISKLQISKADSYQMLQEEAYGAKNSRLASAGYPSYEEAIEWQTSLPQAKYENTKNEQIDFSSAEKKVEKQTQSFPAHSLLRTLQAVFEFKKSNQDVDIIESEKILKESLEEVLFYIKLGKNYLFNNGQKNSEDYKILYRSGRTFIIQGQKKSAEFRVSMIGQNFDWNFLGDTLGNICEDFSCLSIKTGNVNVAAYSLSSTENINDALNLMKLFIQHREILSHYWSLYKGIPNNIKFLNYSKDQINFEVLLTSDLMDFVLRQKKPSRQAGVQLSINDLIQFSNDWKQIKGPARFEIINIFIQQFDLGIKESEIITIFIMNLISSEIESLNILNMKPDDYRHVGGALLVQ